MFRFKFCLWPLGEAQGQVIERHVLSVQKRAFQIRSNEIPARAVPVLYVVTMNLTTSNFLSLKVDKLYILFGQNGLGRSRIQRIR
jgi:hypothetical protein